MPDRVKGAFVLSLELSRLCAAIAPSPTLAIDAKAKEMRQSGRDVVSFSVGEPDFVTPQYIRTAAHEALDMAVPGSRYKPSARQYSGNTMPPEYDEGVMVRKVDISGKLSVKGVSLSAGKAFRGERVGLKETLEDGRYEVWWYSTKVGVIDLKKKSITMGKGC